MRLLQLIRTNIITKIEIEKTFMLAEINKNGVKDGLKL